MNTINPKALIFDLDGTAVASEPKSHPTEAVLAAVKKAHEKVHVTFTTGRSWKMSKDLARLFHIQVPVVTLGGCQVVDPLTGKIIWEQDLDPGIATKVISIAKTYPGVRIYNNITSKLQSLKTYKVKSIEPLVSLQVDEKLAPDLVRQIKKIPLLLVEMSTGWDNGTINIEVKHIHATKFMALQTISKKLSLNPQICIGVGDNGNDITLLNFCGVKIAMGNATSRLKELAQHIAPSVNEDGLAWVIHSFLLDEKPPQPPKK